MIYTFHKGHPFNVKMLKAGLITLLGNAVGPMTSPPDVMVWYWGHTSLRYYLSASIAGQSVVSFPFPDKESEAVVKSWMELSPMKDREEGITFKDDYAEIAFSALDKRWTLEALVAGINTLTGLKPFLHKDAQSRVIKHDWPGYGIELTQTANKPIYVRFFNGLIMANHPIQRVVSAWKTTGE